MKFSVLMSVYSKDNPVFLDEAFRSIVDAQTTLPDQIVIVCDGPVYDAVDQVVEHWRSMHPSVINVVRLENNIGLAGALNAGLEVCEHELVARMDSDDISLPRRFEKQIDFMVKNPDIAVSSAWVEEVEEDTMVAQGVRYVPVHHAEILKFCKRRNPISHPVSIFRKSAIKTVGGYPMFRTSQDYALWSLLLQKGYRMANLPEVLLRMRTGNGLMRRRSFSYLRQEIRIINYQREIGFIGAKDYLYSLIIRSVLRLSPHFLKKKLYRFGRRESKLCL